MSEKLSKEDKEALTKAIRESGNELIQCVKEEIFLCEITADYERFRRLMHLFDAHLNYEFIKALREAGLAKDITKLADKAGKLLKTKKERASRG